MQNCAAIDAAGDTAALLSPSLLLIATSRRWKHAVRAAARELGGARVATCAAREAIVRLAGTAEHYSHVLVQPGSAEGWLAELVGLSIEAGYSPNEMFLLAPPDPPPPRIGVIRSADRRSVRQALVPPSAGASVSEPDMEANELREALAGAMIETRYQPIVRMADRQPIALEALARLNHPTRGTLLPDDFVPQIEDAGLAAQLTDRVGARAFTDMAGAVGALGLLVTLNFPLDVLLVPEALARLDIRREETGIAPDRVVIELTESRPVDDLRALGKAIEHLRRGGYRVSVDDLSPGAPCLKELLTLPFTSAKLDKQVVQSADGPDSARFIETVVATAHRNGMLVIAEGVEDVPTWKRTEKLGADYAQGFLVARPLPAAAVTVWYESWIRRSAL